MKLILILAVVCGALASPTDYYKTLNDSLAYMESVVNDPDKLKSMNDCFLEIGPCDPVEMSYKVLIPDSIQHACQRCTETQKRIAHLFLSSLLSKTPTEHENFVKKFDPHGQYMTKFNEAVKDY